MEEILMSIIVTEVDGATRTKQLLQDAATGFYNQIHATLNNYKLLVFNNPYGLTPQEVLNILDKDAVEMFVIAEKTITLFNDITKDESKQIDATFQPKDQTYKVNVDGTVDLIAKEDIKVV